MSVKIDGKEHRLSTVLTSGEALCKIAKCEIGELYFNYDDGIDIPVKPDDWLIIHGGEKFYTGKPDAKDDNPTLRNPVCPKFNGEKNISLSQAKIQAKDLVTKDKEFPQGQLFANLSDKADERVANTTRLIVQDNDSYLVIPPSEHNDDWVDIEECTKHDRRPPKSGKYRIRIDGEKHIVNTMMPTGATILALVSKKPDDWGLNQKLKGGERKHIASKESIDLSHPGVERFETVRNQASQGSNSIELLPEDKEYLDANYPARWKLLNANATNGIIISKFPIPKGYCSNASDLLIIIPPGYPGIALDMFYFSPGLAKENGRAIETIQTEQHFNHQWQRWSRHYQWMPGEDNLIRHIEFVKTLLHSEA